MKKSNLNLKAKLTFSRETVLSLTAQQTVSGGAQEADNSLVKACAVTMLMPQCCPACRSGANATVAKEFCVDVLGSIDDQLA